MNGTLTLLLWMVLPPMAVWCVSRWQPLFTDRYFIWSALPFYLLIAAGLAVVCRSGKWGRWAVVGLLGLALGLNGLNQWQQATTDGKADYRDATAFVAASYSTSSESAPAVPASVSTVTCHGCTSRVYVPLAMSRYPRDPLIVFQIPHARYTFDYYFPYEGYPWAEGLYTNHRRGDGTFITSEESVALIMQDLMAEHDVVWLFATEAWMWDERGLVKAWLDTNMHLVDEARFRWVDVYRYER
jgi:hypothetical protein